MLSLLRNYLLLRLLHLWETRCTAMNVRESDSLNTPFRTALSGEYENSQREKSMGEILFCGNNSCGHAHSDSQVKGKKDGEMVAVKKACSRLDCGCKEFKT